VTPFGIGVADFWSAISRGQSAARLISAFDASELPSQFAAPLQKSDAELISLVKNAKATKTMSRAAVMAMVAAQESIDDSEMELSGIDPYRVGTCLGTGGLGLLDLDYVEHNAKIVAGSVSERDGSLDYRGLWRRSLELTPPLTPLRSLSNMGTAQIAIALNARGNCLTVTTACTSGTQAIGEGYRQIKFGIADVVIAGGFDSMVNPTGLISFSALGVISRNNDEYRTACRPFDRSRDGFMIGEGAAVFILESLESCRKRGAVPYSEIIGYAASSDAFRITDEPPEAWGSIEAMKMALSDAGIEAQQIDYINAHGTGTRMNDKNETFAIKSVFGKKAYIIPISSTKSMIGHLVAAAGAVEFAACILALKHNLAPPTINYQYPDPECDLDYIPNCAREIKLDTILSNSFGFGGQNACLILKRMPEYQR
jgi:3-oxoacyl-[acyl-carrier-protein] synthase II